jgi:hypothetical protein
MPDRPVSGTMRGCLAGLLQAHGGHQSFGAIVPPNQQVDDDEGDDEGPRGGGRAHTYKCADPQRFVKSCRVDDSNADSSQRGRQAASPEGPATDPAVESLVRPPDPPEYPHVGIISPDRPHGRAIWPGQQPMPRIVAPARV